MNKHSFNFIENYQQKICSGFLQADIEQQLVVEQMQVIHEKIEDFYLNNSNFKIKQWFPFSLDKVEQPVQGIYLWGDVGRGKTFLLDLFFECLSLKNKLRLHFHRFMQIIHESIDDLGDIEDPLKKIAKRFASKYKIICLDEIIVIDIADAMILSELFKCLVSYGVTLLFTSNSAPQNLYKNGLQRARFLPAIDLLSTMTKVLEIKGEDDYRLHALEKTELYQLNANVNTNVNIENLYNSMAGIKLHQDRDDLIINYRCIPVKKWESGIVWFSFDMICNTHRDSSDYIRIAAFFHTVIISDVYTMDAEKDDVMRRFINMIDIFYDRHINLIISAQTMPEQLYSGKFLAFEYARTKSRLYEMQTKAYLSKSKVFKEILDNQLIDMNIEKQRAYIDSSDPTRLGGLFNDKGRGNDF